MKIRYLIEALLKENYSINEIAEITKFNKSSISRELELNSDLYGYSAEYAEEKVQIRYHWKCYFQLRNQIESYPEFTDVFIHKYNKKSFGIKVYIRIKNLDTQRHMIRIFIWCFIF
ncbi:hypothetical protein ACXYFN_03190 [Mycoplasma sp. 48589B]